MSAMAIAKAAMCQACVKARKGVAKVGGGRQSKAALLEQCRCPQNNELGEDAHQPLPIQTLAPANVARTSSLCRASGVRQRTKCLSMLPVARHAQRVCVHVINVAMRVGRQEGVAKSGMAVRGGRCGCSAVAGVREVGLAGRAKVGWEGQAAAVAGWV